MAFLVVDVTAVNRTIAELKYGAQMLRKEALLSVNRTIAELKYGWRLLQNERR